MIRNSTLLLFAFLFISNIALAVVDISELYQDLQKEVKTQLGFVDKKTKPTQAELDNLIRYVFSKGLFSNTEIQKSAQGYKLHVDYLQIINKISLNGNSEVNSIDIQRSLEVEEGGTYSNKLIPQMKEKLIGLYADRGFLNTKIEINVLENSNHTVELTIKVDEGPALKLSTIQIDCRNNTLSKKLQRIVSRFEGKTLNQSTLADLEKDLTDYLRTNRYFRAEIEAPQLHILPNKLSAELSLKISHPELYVLSYEGNYLYPKTEFESWLKLDSYFSRGQDPPQELASRLRDFYLKKGYARADVQYETQSLRDDQIDLLMKISEGPQVKIDKYEITGQFSKPTKFYIDILKNHSSELIHKGFFNKEDFDVGIKNIISELLNQGYLKAKIVSTRIQYNKDKSKITAIINLDEGPITIVENIIFSGNKNVTTETLLSILNLSIDQPLKLIDLEKGIAAIKKYYQDNGFLEIKILNEKEDLVEYHADNTKALLQFRLQEGPKVRVTSIIVDGNTLTKDYVIRKEIDIKEGDILTPQKLTESNRRLQKLGLFNSIELHTLEDNTQIEDRTLIVKVTDRNPGLFNIGPGITSERGLTLRGFTGLAYRNFGGVGRALSGRVDVNYNVTEIKFPETKVVFGFLEPYLFDSRFKGRINLLKSSQVTDFGNRIATDTSQITFSTEQQVTSHILFSYDLWNNSALRDYHIDRNSGIPEDKTNITTTGPVIEIDYRDNPFNPTSGTFTHMQLDYASPSLGSSDFVEFIQGTFNFRHYLKVAEGPIVLANSITLGQLQNLSHYVNGTDYGGVPYSKRGYILGGETTIRGFEAGSSERFPNDTDLGSANYRLTGKANMYLIKSELRFPLPWENVAGAVFYDGGSVLIEGIHFEDSYRDAVGLGLRYITPFGPINLEYARKLAPKASRGEKADSLYISIGTF